METPATLLERLRRPADQAAWVRFVELYTPMLYDWSRRLGLQAEDAADLVQDVFTVLVAKLPEFRYDPHKSFRAYLRTVLLNKWRNRQRLHPEVLLAAGGAPLPERAAPEAPDAFGEAEYRQRLVGRALQLMRTEFQPVTWKACWELVAGGKPAAEVARQLGITPNAVYIAKSRVLRRLREELEGLLD
jgi:RNA polymerase sigma-70 factor (ECF subfamily)